MPQRVRETLKFEVVDRYVHYRKLVEIVFLPPRSVDIL